MARSGRKPVYGVPLKRYDVRLPDHVHAYVYRVGRGNFSEGVRQIVRDRWNSESKLKAGVFSALETYPTAISLYDAAEARISNNESLKDFLEFLLPDRDLCLREGNKNSYITRAYLEWLVCAPDEALIDWGMMKREDSSR